MVHPRLFFSRAIAPFFAEMRAPYARLVAGVRHYVSVNAGDHVLAFSRPLAGADAG